MEWQRRLNSGSCGRWIDAALLAAVLLLGAVTYLAAIPDISFSRDNFVCEMIREGGQLHFFTLYPPKEAGRFFAGSPFILASWLGGAQVESVAWVHFGSHIASVVFLALCLRGLGLPRAAWVFAAVVRLFNGANFNVWDLSSVGVYQAEALFWVAAWLYTVGVTGGLHGRGVRVAAMAVTGAALVLSLGTYNGLWLVAPAWPLGVWLILDRERRVLSWGWIAAWYVAILLIVVPSTVFTILHPPGVQGAGGWLANFLGGLGITFGDMPQRIVRRGWEVFTLPQHYFFPPIVWLGVVVAAGFALSWWNPRPAGGKAWPVEARLMLAALGLSVLVVAPIAARYAVEFGNRTVQYASLATFLFYGAAVTWLVRALLRRWFWGQWAVLLAVALFTAIGTSSFIFETEHLILERGRGDRVFWQRLAELAPRLKPGTVVIYDGGAQNGNMDDSMATMLLRAITGEDSVFMLVPGGPDAVTEPDAGHFAVTSGLDLKAPPAVTEAPQLMWVNPCRWPPGLPAPQEQLVPKANVLWMTGFGSPEAIRFVPERSNLDNVQPGPSTGFMQRLMGE